MSARGWAVARRNMIFRLISNMWGELLNTFLISISWRASKTKWDTKQRRRVWGSCKWDLVYPRNTCLPLIWAAVHSKRQTWLRLPQQDQQWRSTTWFEFLPNRTSSRKLLHFFKDKIGSNAESWRRYNMQSQVWRHFYKITQLRTKSILFPGPSSWDSNKKKVQNYSDKFRTYWMPIW